MAGERGAVKTESWSGHLSLSGYFCELIHFPVYAKYLLTHIRYLNCFCFKCVCHYGSICNIL